MSDRPGESFYLVLGVPPTATHAEIGAAYRALAIKYHPDSTGGESQASAMFRKVAHAYDVLSDPDQRGRYDRQMAPRVRYRAKGRTPTGRATSPHRLNPLAAIDLFVRFAELAQLVRGFAGIFSETRPFAFEPAANAPPPLIEGELEVTPEEALTGATVAITLTLRHPCSRCAGAAAHEAAYCRSCAGRGCVFHRDPIRVVLPRGIDDGSVINVRNFTRPKGIYDLRLRVRIRPWR